MDGPQFIQVERLKEELAALIKYVQINKADGHRDIGYRFHPFETPWKQSAVAWGAPGVFSTCLASRPFCPSAPVRRMTMIGSRSSQMRTQLAMCVCVSLLRFLPESCK